MDLFGELIEKVLPNLGQLVHVDCPLTIHTTFQHIGKLLLIRKRLPSFSDDRLTLFAFLFWKDLLNDGNLFTTEESVRGQELKLTRWFDSFIVA